MAGEGCNRIWDLNARPRGQERGLGEVHLSGSIRYPLGPGQGLGGGGEVRTLGPALQRAVGNRMDRPFPSLLDNAGANRGVNPYI